MWRIPNEELLLRPASAQSGIVPPEAPAHLRVSTQAVQLMRLMMLIVRNPEEMGDYRIT